jgi:hypothetical protein
MTSIREIFTTFAPEYLQHYSNTMPKTHRKVIDAIIACRTEACGIALYQCDSCAKPSQFFRSCGNRHCPTCQYSKAQQWLQTQITRQLPGHHFLITFTLPQQLRSFMRQHQRLGYSAMFKASSDAIKKLAIDPKYIGADISQASSVCSIPGDAPCSIIPISTTSSRVGLCVPPMALGIPPKSISFSPSKRSPKSSVPNSVIS